uniref:Uncharacterized protein n=1 Tax=Anguilla anguilla TaxID=7936 RepID=A0A0E9U2S8_ANGAN
MYYITRNSWQLHLFSIPEFPPDATAPSPCASLMSISVNKNIVLKDMSYLALHNANFRAQMS